MSPFDVASAWPFWLLIVGCLACVWFWGSEALDALQRRANRKDPHTVHDVVIDPDVAAWRSIVEHERGHW